MLEGEITAIAEPELYYEVQEMFKYNQRATAHKNVNVDFRLLTTMIQPFLAVLLNLR